MKSDFKTEQEAIDAFNLKVMEEGYVDFDGQNCENYIDYCAGWDGESRRCDCGNRRVYLATAEHADGTWYAYAEAY